MFQATSRRHAGDVRRWPDVLQRAQLAIARQLAQAAASPGFGRDAYFDWLACEAAIAVLGADALDALAGWHGNDGELRATAQAWAAELRAMARLAAADLGAAGADTRLSPSLAPLPEAWSAFLATASVSQRAGEALGAIALHSRLLPGQADPALDAMRALPFAQAASRYLARRRHPEPCSVSADRDRLLEAYAAAAIAAGAERAATWATDAVALVQVRCRG